MTDRTNALSSRNGIVGTVLVLVVLAAQSWWMGRAVALLSVGLIIAYLFWISDHWKNDPKAILPMYLLAIAVQCVDFAEEYVTGFQRQFPKLIGYEWSDARFVTFNMAWLAVFVLAGLGVYRRVQLAYLAVLFLELGGGRVELCRSSTFECNGRLDIFPERPRLPLACWWVSRCSLSCSGEAGTP